MIIKDQLQRTLDVKTTPSRIISLVPSLTELIVDLGLGPSLVGVTKFCVHPKDIKRTSRIVGGTKQVHFDKIRGLKPDIILCNKEENTPEMIEILRSIATVHISDIYTIEDCYALIRMYGTLFAVQKKAHTLVQEIEHERMLFQRQLDQKRRPRIIYFIWKKPWMVAGSHTFIHTMITEAGFENVVADLSRYPQIELKSEYLKTADQIFLSSEPYPFKEKHRVDLQGKFPGTPVHIVDGELFSWYGSRLRSAYKYFRTLQEL